MAGLKDYRGRVAVVTGASSGIGREMALRLAHRGMHVALVARRKERLRELAERISGEGGAASVHPCDVSDRGSVASCAARIRGEQGRVDLLVNAAAKARHVLFADHDPDDIEDMVRTNILGTIHWIREVLPPMRERGEGWILNFSSIAGLLAQPDEAVYSATKFAVSGLSDAVSYELEPLGIHVLCVYPVLVRTEMFTPEILERLPPGNERRFMPADRFVTGVLKALERGERHVVLPRRYRGLVLLKALFPGWLGRKIASVRLQALKGGPGASRPGPALRDGRSRQEEES